MKVYITKYALTKGIYIEDAKHDGKFVIVSKPGFIDQYLSYGEYHISEAAAIKQANEMKKKKIASLKKQLKKIQALTFEP